MQDNPWLKISAEDYEAHMNAAGQSASLRDLFAMVYVEFRPTRLAVLGCTTGADLQRVDRTVTEVMLGVDINAHYLEIARRRLSSFGPRLHLVHGDALSVELPRVSLPFDLVHAALLLEYVEPSALFRRMNQWLSPTGICSVITQETLLGHAPVSSTGYETLQILAGHMTLRGADEVATLATHAGLHLLRKRAVTLPTGKSLVSSIFGKGRHP